MKSEMFRHKWLEKSDPSTQSLIKEQLKPVTYQKGEYVHYVGDRADGVFYIEQGTVRINKIHSDGKELIIKDLDQGEWFGFIGCFGKGKRPNDAVVLSETKIQHLSGRSLENVLERCPLIALSLAEFIAGYVEFYNGLYERTIFMSLKSRLENTLQQLCQWKGTTTLDISQSELAAIIGVTKEAIGIHLNELRSEGLVEIGYRKIEVKGVRPSKSDEG